MRTQSRDTRPEMERVQIELIRKAPAAKLFDSVRSFSFLIQASRDNFRQLRSALSEEDFLCLLFTLHYDKSLADHVRTHLQKCKARNKVEPDIALAIIPIIDAFEQLSIPYYIGGSLTSSIYGLPRLTTNIDLVVSLQQTHIQPLTRLLETAYSVDTDMLHDIIKRGNSCSFIHYDTLLKVTIFVSQPHPFDQDAFQRRKEQKLLENKHNFYFASAEDIVLYKLEWYKMRKGLSDQQWNDILGVLKVQGTNIDIAYLRKWAMTLAVSDLLERAFVDAGFTEEAQNP